jgi:hypothetical protein
MLLYQEGDKYTHIPRNSLHHYVTCRRDLAATNKQQLLIPNIIHSLLALLLSDF